MLETFNSSHKYTFSSNFISNFFLVNSAIVYFRREVNIIIITIVIITNIIIIIIIIIIILMEFSTASGALKIKPVDFDYVQKF